MTSRTGKLCVTTTTYSPSRTRTASACLIKSCKNWSSQKEKSIRDADTAKKNGYDAGKTSGIKLHIEVYAMGLPHAIYMTTANITDRSGAINMVEYGCNVKKSIPSPENSD